MSLSVKVKKKWLVYTALSAAVLAIVYVLLVQTAMVNFLASFDLSRHVFIGKSVWDWLSLLGVPFSLAVLGFWFQQLQKRRDAAKEREQRHQEEERAKEAILQAYFDRLSEVLIDKNIIAISVVVEGATQDKDTDQEIDEALGAKIKLVDAVRDVIRARTLSILRRFENDGRRKGSIIQFLSESEIINKLGLDLSGADLAGADLSQFNLQDAQLSGVNFGNANLNGAKLHGADLSRVNFHGADLKGANLFASDIKFADFRNADLRSTNFGSADLCDTDLRGANLHGADLRDSKLSGANLSDAKLYGAKLCRADLRGAKLFKAKLRGTDLSGSNLRGTNFDRTNVRDADFTEANLSGADLSTAEELINDQLNNAFLCKTILPFHEPSSDRDCDKLCSHTKSDYIIVESSPGLRVPDSDPLGIMCVIEVLGDSFKVRDIEVSVDITHSYVADLIVALISPKGTVVDLHDRASASSSNIIETYTVENTPELHRFIDEFAQGTWKLRVADVGGNDVGKLNRFLIKILK